METMSRRLRAGAMMMVAGLVLAACDAGSDDAGADGEGAAAEGALVATAQGEPGTFLVDAEGMTLYLFTNDSPGMSTCTEECLVAWPAVLTDDAPVAGDGVDASLLGTTTRDDGTVQVTYADWPLYRFAADAAPGDLAGQGVNDVWFVVSPEGRMLGAEADAPSGMGMDDADEYGGSYGSDPRY